MYFLSFISLNSHPHLIVVRRLPTIPYSACASSASPRLVSQISVEHRALQHTFDVSDAYYEGVRPTIAEGGRLVYARVPSWLADYGNFPTHDEVGSPNYIWITGNMAGCADAGCIWETAYDKHLINVYKNDLISLRLTRLLKIYCRRLHHRPCSRR